MSGTGSWRRDVGHLWRVFVRKVDFVEIGMWDELVPDNLDFADFAGLTPNPAKGRVDAIALVQVEPMSVQPVDPFVVVVLG